MPLTKIPLFELLESLFRAYTQPLESVIPATARAFTLED